MASELSDAFKAASDTWRGVKSNLGGRRQVISYISDDPDLASYIIWNQGDDFRSMRGARWQVYLMDRDLIGGIDLETVEKLVERIRRGAVNAIRADCAKTLAEAKATARRRAVMFKGEATGDAV